MIVGSILRLRHDSAALDWSLVWFLADGAPSSAPMSLSHEALYSCASQPYASPALETLHPDAPALPPAGRRRPIDASSP